MQIYQVKELQHKADRAAFLTISCRKTKIKINDLRFSVISFDPPAHNFEKKK